MPLIATKTLLNAQNTLIGAKMKYVLWDSSRLASTPLLYIHRFSEMSPYSWNSLLSFRVFYNSWQWLKGRSSL